MLVVSAELYRAASNANDLVRLLNQKWKIVTPDHRVREPGDEHIMTAWKKLDDFFPAGDSENPLRPVILSLLNPPYGYDYNTLVLVFCAWFGFNSHNLRISANGTVTNIQQLDQWLQSGPKEFVQSLLCEKAAISRRDSTKATKEIKALLAKVKGGGLAKKDAKDIRAKLEDFASSDKNDAGLLEDVKKAIENINEGMEITKNYEEQAERV